jgi:hypothetical protein
LYPWLDYDPGTFDRVLSRPEYKAVIQTAINALKNADPTIQCLGSIETDWVAIDLDQIDPVKRFPAIQTPAWFLIRLKVFFSTVPTSRGKTASSEMKMGT